MKAITKFFKESFKLPQLLGITSDAEEQRNELALAAVKCKSVSNVDEQAKAASAAVGIQTYIKSVRDAGLAFRRPINDFASLIKKTEDEHIYPLLEEKSRLGVLLADFDAKERRRVAEEERKRQAQFQQAETDRLEKERLANEAATKAEASGNKKAIKKAEQLADAATAAGDTVQSIIGAAVPERSRASGVAVKEVLKWEVTDIGTLYRARPELCNIEPKASAIKATCNPDKAVPGLKLWWKNQAVIRKA